MASLTRDQILNRALDMAAAPALNSNDRPAGTIVSTALSIQWLQDGVNLFADEFPWAQMIATATLTIPVTGLVPLPADFIMDVRDGIYIVAGGTVSGRRLRRTSYQKMLDRVVFLVGVGSPMRYTILPPNVQIWPTTRDAAYTVTLAYYARPATLGASSIPIFPSDLPLIEYVRLRGLEWLRATEAGSALKYAQQQIADLRKSGLGHEPEDDTIPFDKDQFIPMGDATTTSWMGPLSQQ